MAVAADYDGDKADPCLWRSQRRLEGHASGAAYWEYDSSVYGAWAEPAIFPFRPITTVMAVRSGGQSESGNEWIVMLSTAGYTPTHLTLLFE